MEERQRMKNGMRFEDKHEMRGILEYKIYRHQGSAKKLIAAYKDENLIVDGARDQMARLIAGDFTDRNITKIAFGTNGEEPTVADTSITNAFVKNVLGFAYQSMGQVTISWNLLTSEDNGQAIIEFGLICADDTLFSRRIRTNPIYKEDDISIEGQWTIIF